MRSSTFLMSSLAAAVMLLVVAASEGELTYVSIPFTSFGEIVAVIYFITPLKTAPPIFLARAKEIK